MKIHEADEKLEQIQKLADEIANDDELRGIDPRYSITANWIDTDINNTDPDQIGNFMSTLPLLPKRKYKWVPHKFYNEWIDLGVAKKIGKTPFEIWFYQLMLFDKNNKLPRGKKFNALARKPEKFKANEYVKTRIN